MREIAIKLTEADLYNHPELGMAGYKVGQKVTIKGTKEGNGDPSTNIVGGRPDDRG